VAGSCFEEGIAEKALEAIKGAKGCLFALEDDVVRQLTQM
jgi:hypothetical protein